MGKLENESQSRRKKNQIRNAILSTVQAVGLIGLAIAVPNVIQHLEEFGLRVSPRQSDLIKRATHRMVKQGLLVWVDGKLRLTEKGKRTYMLYQQTNQTAITKKRWDGKWRVLIFDIPERRRIVRDRIRIMLQEVGFVRLQDSVWIFPYDCEDITILIKADTKIGKDMLYMIVDTLENDVHLRKHFSLPLE